MTPPASATPPILLVGGNGFLGRSLSVRLATYGFPVSVLDQCPPADASCLAFVGDLRDRHLLRAALKGHPSVVYLVHESKTMPSADSLPENFLSNIELFLTVLHEAMEAGVELFTLFSSGGAVYGESLESPIQESHPNHPRSPYGIAKLTMEKYLAMASAKSGFRHLIIRPSNPYGPGQNFRGNQGIVAIAMARIARGEPVSVFGDGSAVKDFIYIDDFAAAACQIISHPTASGVFNAGSGTGTTILELLSAIARVVGKEPLLEFHPPVPGDVSANILDCSKLTAQTGWTPTVSLEDGLRHTWDWMQPQIFRRTTD